MKRNYNITVIVIIVVLITFSITIGLLLNDKDEQIKLETFQNLTYNAYNRYETATVYEDKMASLYLINYYSYLIYDKEKAFNLLDENYRKDNFSGLSDFAEFINNLSLSNNVKSYKVEIVDNNYIFKITTETNLLLTFNTTGVMQYSVIIGD